MHSLPLTKRRLALLIVCLVALLSAIPETSHAQSPVAPYDWKPVRVGAGGFVTGMTIHPLDPEVRYARTDVGNGYRWDVEKSEWIPMLVRNVEDDTGLPDGLVVPPVTTGVESLEVDPSNIDVVYMGFILKTSNDVSSLYPSSTGALYKSTDRGLNFTRTGLIVPMQPNGATRHHGERIAVDPNNSDIVYYGSVANGLHSSFDGATTWGQVGNGGPAETADVINVVFDPRTTIAVNGQTRSANVYAAVFNGSIFRSTDGGVTWASISTGLGFDGVVRFMTIGPDGKVHVAKRSTKEVWQFADDTWVMRSVNPTWGSITSIAVDPLDPNRIFTMSDGGSLTRSLNGGVNWTSLANEFLYANTLAWLPQYPNGYRSNGGIKIDTTGRLWVPQGNEGVLTYALDPENLETGNPRIQWTIQSQGIEELVGHDVIIPPGSGDKPVISVHDATAFFIDDPDQFTASMAQLQDQLISNGIGLAYCPNEPTYVVVFSSDANFTRSGRNYSGYSADGGRTWTRFGSQPIEYRAGQIAVSRRDGWGLGQDRIVILPSQGRLPKYSHDGGQTWHQSTGVDQGSGDSMAEGGMINFAVRQRLLVADPLVANKFYLGSLSGKFYVSTDGGMTWTPRAATGLAAGRFHAQMEANRTRPNDLWFVSGWEGTFPSRGVNAAGMHGLFRSNDEGASFQRNPAVEYAICLALGAPSGLPGDAEFSVYFYGKLVGDPQWGVFRSVDEGLTWTRVAYYPAGIFDWPSMMAASWDTFGLLYITLNGNTAVYGRPSGTQPPLFDASTPANRVVNLGQSVTFQAQILNQPLPTFQWQRKEAEGATWTNIENATDSSLTFTPVLADHGTFFRVVATNEFGQSISRFASLEVTTLSAPVFVTPPQSQSAVVGAIADFFVTVSGSPAPTLQWQIRTTSTGSWSNLTNATGPTYSRVMALADDGIALRVVATNSQGTATSAAASLTLQPLTALPSASATLGPFPLVVGFEGFAIGGRFDGAADTTDDLPGTISARGEASTTYSASKAFDNATNSNWRDNAPDATTRASWLQYSYNNGVRRTIGSYAIRAANDNPPNKRDYDPYNWALLGSDDGVNWTVLDTRTAQSFTKGQRRVFNIDPPRTFGHYRLRIDRVRTPSGTTFVQLAEFELLRTSTYVYTWDFGDGRTSTEPYPEVTFETTGSHTVIMTATDSRSSAQATLTIDVAPPETPLNLWKKELFTQAELADPLISGDDADPDGDGIPNLVEYALNRDPMSSNSSAPLTVEPEPGVLTLEFVRAREDIRYSVLESFDLVGWTVIATNPGAVSLSEPVRYSVPIDPDGKNQFYRLEIRPQ